MKQLAKIAFFCFVLSWSSVARSDPRPPQKDTPAVDKNSPEYLGGFAGGCAGSLAGLEAYFGTKAPPNICEDQQKFEAWKKKMEERRAAKRAARRQPRQEKPAVQTPAEPIEKEVRVKVKIDPEVAAAAPPDARPAPTSYVTPVKTPSHAPFLNRSQGPWSGLLDVGTKAMPGTLAMLGGADLVLPVADQWLDFRVLVGPAWVKKNLGTVTRFASDFSIFLRLPQNFSIGPTLSFAGAPIVRPTYMMIGGTLAYQWNLGNFGIRPELTLGHLDSKIDSIGSGFKAIGGLLMVYQAL